MHDGFTDRDEAGRQLAQALLALRLPPPVVVLALPRGGVPVAVPVARALHAPLDLLLVRKIGLPGQPELALAAVVDGDPPDLVIDDEVQRRSGVSRARIDAELPAAQREIERRRAAYRPGRAPLPVAGRTVIVVDDGIATGTTMRAALKALRRRAPARLVVAVPVAPPDAVRALNAEGCRVVCLLQPRAFYAVGAHYRDFHQIEDDELLAALAGVD